MCVCVWTKGGLKRRKYDSTSFFFLNFIPWDTALKDMYYDGTHSSITNNHQHRHRSSSELSLAFHTHSEQIKEGHWLVGYIIFILILY